MNSTGTTQRRFKRYSSPKKLLTNNNRIHRNTSSITCLGAISFLLLVVFLFAIGHRAFKLWHQTHSQTSSLIFNSPNINSSKSFSTSTDSTNVKYLSESSQYRKDSAKISLSAVVLFHKEYSSFQYALNSWIERGLIDYIDQLLVFMNGLTETDDIQQKLPQLFQQIPQLKRKIVWSPQNLPLGKAIVKMVKEASGEHVLLLEKDWALIEPKHILESRLIDSKVLIHKGIANVVRHRHRYNPGVPLHALIMHQGREDSIFKMQENLLCYVHHWIQDPSKTYPYRALMYKCGRKEANSEIEEENIYCSNSQYCQWTNNPCLFERKWFIEQVGNRFETDFEIEREKEGDDSPFLDFEYYLNWREYAWGERNFTVAVGEGLFSHAEQEEHNDFNTFWYAHYRLTVDLEEIRNQYLTNETEFKRLGGVHYHPAYPSPPPLIERYPVDFVRKFHWSQTFTGNLSTQRQMINKVYQPYLDKFRILTDEEWKIVGADSQKAQQQIDWRNYVTQLDLQVEKAMMITPPKQPHEMSITLVTCVMDIGRDSLDNDDYQFRRDFQMYLDAMIDWLTHEYPKVVYTTVEVAQELKSRMSEHANETTKFVYTTREDLKTKWLGHDNYERVQQIRQSKQWLNRAGWLSNSPQVKLKDYNPLVMSKMFMMRHASRENYWNTSHFLFIDSKHNCRNPSLMTPKNDHILRAHMFDKFLMTTFDYIPNEEVHGFEYESFNQYCNKQNPKQKQLLLIGRGGIFGGSAFVIEYISAMYDVILTASLRQGLMGTEENIFTILLYQVAQYIDPFNNNWACPDNIEKDHSCRDMQMQGNVCAIFSWVGRDAVE